MKNNPWVTFIDFEKVVPGSVTARQNGEKIKVKEKLRYSWDKKRPVVVGIEVFGADMFGAVNLRYLQHCDDK